VDERFWKLASSSSSFGEIPNEAVFLNQPLAAQLRVKVGDDVLLRISKPDLLSQDAPMSPKGNGVLALRVRVHAVVSDADLGRFGLRTEPTAPLNAFVALRQLQEGMKQTNRANLLLVPPASRLVRRIGFPLRDFVRSVLREHISVGLAKRVEPYRIGQIASSLAVATLQNVLTSKWAPDDAELQLLALLEQNTIELRSRRVFLDTIVVDRVMGKPIRPHERWGEAQQDDFERSPPVAPNAEPILTYLANLLCAGTNAAPYSMVTAAGPPWTPQDLRDDEIFVSQWLAEDLQVKPGDQISLTYFDPESGAQLVERTNTFRVRGVVPMEMPWADRTLMPDFPGIEKAESTRDWDAGFPLVHRIRPKDEDYWKQHRGTPKAFITLAGGQKMWSNRFGDLTAIRFPVPGSESRLQAAEPGDASSSDRLKAELQTAEEYRAALDKKILATLKPEELGLRFEPVREQALKAAEQSQDFGQLFLGFSFFLIAAALLLMALLFQLGLEQRAPEIGTLLALGFTPKQVRRFLLGEGVSLALLGGALGALGGMAYAKAMLHGLTTIWRDAVGVSALSFHMAPQTLVIGLCASVVVSAVTIWLTLRKFVRRPAWELLDGEVLSLESSGRSRGRVIGVGALVLAAGLVGVTLANGDTANAGAFFGAGALVLVAGLSLVSAWLGRLGEDNARPHPAPFPQEREDQHQFVGKAKPKLTLGSLGLRGCARRRKRSVATVAMLACGSFLVVAIGVFRLDANRDASWRSSGTGGFALIGETTMPVVQDLNSRSGRDFFALNESDLAGVGFVPFRVREGDEASCLNLNRAQKPRVLGVKPEMLKGRFGFAKGAGWAALTRIADGQSPISKATTSEIRNPKPEVEIPAIGDANSIQWAMGKKVGDAIGYVDERGRSFRVRLVAAVANSILQGSLIIDEAEFAKRFPGESGYRMFLIDAPSNAVSQVSATLSRAMQDVGLELTPAAQRLAQFNAVQNTYLSTFQILGGLGLLLGSVGLGIVVLRNVLERRGELAVLLAVGFRAKAIQRMLLVEHGALLALGLAIGVVAAAVAVLPSVLSPTMELPMRSLGITLAAVLANGMLWVWLSTWWALRGDLLAALRNE